MKKSAANNATLFLFSKKLEPYLESKFFKYIKKYMPLEQQHTDWIYLDWVRDYLRIQNTKKIRNENSFQSVFVSGYVDSNAQLHDFNLTEHEQMYYFFYLISFLYFCESLIIMV